MLTSRVTMLCAKTIPNTLYFLFRTTSVFRLSFTWTHTYTPDAIYIPRFAFPLGAQPGDSERRVMLVVHNRVSSPVSKSLEGT